ncbi:oxidoreductase [Aureococcus anophagefferens]|nr:oxidoreductase [Aureococcus anophagefferens]
MAEDRSQANFKSIVGRREGVDTPDAATIRAEVEASSAYLRSFRARESANASHFSNELDLGVVAGLVHDVRRLWGMIGRSLAHLLWSVVAQEARFIAGRTLVRYRARHKKIIEDVHICIDYTQDAQEEGAGLMAMSPPEINSLAPPPPGGEKKGMAYRKLGSSELRVSVCSFGGANWAAELMGVSHQGLGERRAMIFEMLDLAYARGVTFFDMAEQYPPVYPSITGGGYSEFVFGEWLRVRAIDRDSVVISTKVAAATRIRAWGVSNETTYGVATFCAMAKLKGLPPPASIQNDYSLCDRRFETELAEACSPLHGDVGLVAYGVLCGGTLAGKYSFGRKPPGEARHKNMPGFQSRYTSAATLKAAEDYEELAKAHGMTVLQLSLAYAYSRPFLATAILGARPAQLEAQLEALDHVAKITPELCRKIDRVHRLPERTAGHAQPVPV